MEAEEYEVTDPRVRHGRLFNSTCLLQPTAKDGLWKDEPTVVERKISALRDLVRMSKRTIVYTEAVTQEAPLGHYGTGQCALSHKQDVKTLPSNKVPSSYQDLARLAHAGLIQAWVQLGHDGLPQKSGFTGPIREVYDSWRDHHKDGYKEELNVVDAELAQADLVLVVTFGSAFSGSSAKVVSQVITSARSTVIAAELVVSVINPAPLCISYYKQNKLYRLVYDDSRQLECPRWQGGCTGALAAALAWLFSDKLRLALTLSPR